MKLNVDKFAPILPGIGLGGLILGGSVEELHFLLHGALPSRDFDGVICYTIKNGAIILNFDDSTRLLFCISAALGYEGCLFDDIKIGEPISILFQRGENWVYDDWHGGYKEKKYPGVMVAPVLVDATEREASNSIIGEISVFSEKYTINCLA